MSENNLFERVTRLPVLPLQKISLLYCATAIFCNNPELISLITKCTLNEEFNRKLALKNVKDYKVITAKANELISKLPEIGKFKKMILDLVWPITFRITRWKSIYAPSIDSKFLQHFYWKSHGRLDIKRTTKCIIENKRIPIIKRFIMACSLCLEKEILEIWKDMSDDGKKILLEEDCGKMNHFLCFWTSKLLGEKDKLQRNFNEALECAVKIGSIDAVKYLFNLIQEPERSEKAVICFRTLFFNLDPLGFFQKEENDIGYFLLSQMTENIKTNLLNCQLLAVLTILLYFPGQNEVVNVLRDKLDLVSENDIKVLISHIFCKLFLGIFKDYDYFKLFVDVLQILPDETRDELKDFFLEGPFCTLVGGCYRFILLKTPCKKARKRDTTSQSNLVEDDKWKLLIFFIEKDIVTIESLKNNKISVLKSLRIKNSNKLCWRKLLNFVKDKTLKKPQ